MIIQLGSACGVVGVKIKPFYLNIGAVKVKNLVYLEWILVYYRRKSM